MIFHSWWWTQIVREVLRATSFTFATRSHCPSRALNSAWPDAMVLILLQRDVTFLWHLISLCPCHFNPCAHPITAALALTDLDDWIFLVQRWKMSLFSQQPASNTKKQLKEDWETESARDNGIMKMQDFWRKCITNSLCGFEYVRDVCTPSLSNSHTNNPLVQTPEPYGHEAVYDVMNESENLHMHSLHSQQQHDSVLPRPPLCVPPPFSKDHHHWQPIC